MLVIDLIILLQSALFVFDLIRKSLIFPLRISYNKRIQLTNSTLSSINSPKIRFKLPSIPMKLRGLNALEKLAKQDPRILKLKPAKLIEKDPISKEAYPESTAAWRNMVHRSKGRNLEFKPMTIVSDVLNLIFFVKMCLFLTAIICVKTTTMNKKKN